LKIEEPPFINRQSELTFFKQKAEEIAQGKGENLFFVSSSGIGKTALLKELKERLFWGQEKVIPVYFSFSRDYLDLLDFSEEYLVTLLSQVLLFDQKEGVGTGRDLAFSFPDLHKEAERQGKDIFADIILSHQAAVRGKDERNGVLNALAAGRRIARAGNRPIWMMIDHIQAIETLTISGKEMAGLWKETLSSPWVPHLFSGEPPGFLVKHILPAFGLPDIPVMELLPLPDEEGDQLALALGKYFNLSIAGDLCRTWFHYLEGNPGLLSSIVRDARREASGLESHRRFIEVYLKSLGRGELGRLFENRLYHFKGMEPSNGLLLLRILNKLSKSDDQRFDLPDLQNSLDLSYESIQSVIRPLERAGIISEGFGTIGLEKNHVLRDWVEVLLRKYLYREDPSQINKQLGDKIEKTFSDFTEEKEGPPPFPAGENILHFSLILPINSESELVAVRALEQIATYTELDAAAIEKLKAALIEACINAGEHSRSLEKKIRIYFTAQPERIEIAVEDQGKAFDPLEVQARMVRERDSLAETRGRGLVLIKEMVDEIRFEKTGSGTRLYMIKNKSTPPPAFQI
jgi:serine/threonine-protein kinase RsbW